MDRLPRVLQKEIWEYVRGDRAFWRTQFQKTADHMEVLGHHAAGEIALGHDSLPRSKVMLKWRKDKVFVEASCVEIRRAIGEPPAFPVTEEVWFAHLDKWSHYNREHLWRRQVPRGQKCPEPDCPFGS